MTKIDKFQLSVEKKDKISEDNALQTACANITKLIYIITKEPMVIKEVNNIRYAISNIVTNLNGTEMQESADIVSEQLAKWDGKNLMQLKLLLLNLNAARDTIVDKLPILEFTQHVGYIDIFRMFD